MKKRKKKSTQKKIVKKKMIEEKEKGNVKRQRVIISFPLRTFLTHVFYLFFFFRYCFSSLFPAEMPIHFLFSPIYPCICKDVALL